MLTVDGASLHKRLIASPCLSFACVLTCDGAEGPPPNPPPLKLDVFQNGSCVCFNSTMCTFLKNK